MSPYLPYVIPLAIAALITCALGVFSVQRYRRPAAAGFSVAMFAAMVWSIGLILELLAPWIEQKIFWADVQYIAINALFSAWFLMTLDFAGYRWLVKKLIAPLSLFVCVQTAIIWTNGFHHLFRKAPSLIFGSPFPLLDYDYGPWFYLVQVPYGYGLLISSVAVLIFFYARSRASYRHQSLALLLGITLPTINTSAYILKLSPIPWFDIAPIIFCISGLFLAWSFFRYRFLDLVPVARETLVDIMSDAWLVLDTNNRFVDLNRSAATFLGRPAAQLIGRSAEEEFESFPALLSILSSTAQQRIELAVNRIAATLYFDVQMKPLLTPHGRITGRMLVLHDVTEREKLTQDLLSAIEEVKSLSGMLPICGNCKKIRDDNGYWHAVESYISSHSDAEFSHGICPDCIEKYYPDYAAKKKQ